MEATNNEALYQPSPEMLAAIAEAEKALETRAKIDKAVIEKRAEIKAAESACAEALEKSARAETDLAFGADSEEAANLEKAADRAVKQVESTRLQLDRKRRALDAFYQKGEEADAEVESAKSLLNTERAIFATAILEQYRTDLNSSLEPLKAMLIRGRALQAALLSRSLGYFLADVKIPDPTDLSGVVNLVDSRFGIDWAADEAASALFSSLRQLRDMEGKLSAHKSFAESIREAIPYQRKGFTTHGRAGDAAPFEHQKPVAAAPAAEKGRLPERQELNMGSGVGEERAPRQLRGDEPMMNVNGGYSE